MSQSFKTRPDLTLILSQLGHAKQDGYQWLKEYVDPKSRFKIVGFVDLQDLSFTQVFVKLNLGQANETSSGFLIRRQANDVNEWTLVDVSTQDGHGFSTYQRPGKWLDVVASLANGIRHQQIEKSKLHRMPVEDENLFGDS
jgi:hypothetical protein